MALAITRVATGNWASATGSFTPANNSLLVAVVFAVDDPTSQNINNLTVSGGSLTWTARVSGYGGAGSGAPSVCKIFTAPVTTGASMTVNASGIGGGGNYQILVYQLTGYNTGTPIGATGSSTSLTNALSYSLSGSPASSSYIISAFCEQANGGSSGASAGSGWTIDYNSASNWGWIRPASEYITGVTSSTVSWTDTCIGDSNFSLGAAAIEINAAGGSPKSLLPFRKLTRFFNRRY